MKKRISAFVFAALLLFSFSFSVFAVKVDEFYYEDGNTLLGVFNTTTLTEAQKQVVRDWLNSPSNLLIKSYGSTFYFVTIPANNDITVQRKSDGLARVMWNVGGVKIFCWSDYDSNTRKFTNFVEMLPTSTYYIDGILICGTAIDTLTFPAPFDTYIADIQGELFFVDDGGLFAEGSGGSTDGENSGGLWEWLKNFWDSLLDFVKSIFIPDEDYFNEWYESIRSKANEKFSALFYLYDVLTDTFKSQQGGDYTRSVFLNIPANHFYAGSPAIKADLLEWALPFAAGFRGFLTACVIIFTGIICYRRLVVIFEK